MRLPVRTLHRLLSGGAIVALAACSSKGAGPGPDDTGNVFGVWAASPQDIYYVDEGPSIGQSHDGGKTWSAIVGFGGSANYGDMTGIWGNGPDAIYVTGGRGVVERSTDRGATWIREATSTGSSIYVVAGSAAGELAIGGSHGGILLHR